MISKGTFLGIFLKKKGEKEYFNNSTSDKDSPGKELLLNITQVKDLLYLELGMSLIKDSGYPLNRLKAQSRRQMILIRFDRYHLSFRTVSKYINIHFPVTFSLRTERDLIPIQTYHGQNMTPE